MPAALPVPPLTKVPAVLNWGNAALAHGLVPIAQRPPPLFEVSMNWILPAAAGTEIEVAYPYNVFAEMIDVANAGVAQTAAETAKAGVSNLKKRLAVIFNPISGRP
jgi:hypothetical protein